MQGSKVMRQRHAETLAPEEPNELIAHVRVCGGAEWVTTGSTRKPTAYSVRCAPASGGGSPPAFGVNRRNDLGSPMATKHDLQDWVQDALSANGGRATLVEVANWSLADFVYGPN